MEKNYNNDSNLIKFEYDGKTYSFQEAIKNKIVEYREIDDDSLLQNIGCSYLTIGNNTIVKFGKFKFAPNNGGGLLFGKKKEFKHLSDNFSHDHGDKYSIKGKLEGQKIDIWAVEPCYENDQYLLVKTCEPETIKGSQGQVFKGTTFIVDKKTGEIVDVKKTIDAAGQQETNTEINNIKNLDDSKKNKNKCCNIF